MLTYSHNRICSSQIHFLVKTDFRYTVQYLMAYSMLMSGDVYYNIKTKLLSASRIIDDE